MPLSDIKPLEWLSLALVTLPAWGKYPEPPVIMQDLFDKRRHQFSEILRYVALFAFAWLIVGQRDYTKALLAVGIFYVFKALLNTFAARKAYYYAAMTLASQDTVDDTDNAGDAGDDS